MKFTAGLFLLVAMAGTLHSQAPPTLLWPEGAPGAQGNADEDKPAVTVFSVPPEKRSRTAVIVYPGGGYAHLASDHEGRQVAQWLNERGITAFVVRYRLGPKYHHPVQMHDGQRAIRWVRAHAAEYGFAEDRLGVWGFSAGGHLASTVGTHFDEGNASAPDPVNRQSSKPSFLILCYPVIAMDGPHVHRFSREMLLGKEPSPELMHELSNETQVTKTTPPTFLFTTMDDQAVPVQNSILFYSALVRAGVPSELHAYQHGRHGVGLATGDPILRSWTARLDDWLRLNGWR